MRFAHPYDLLDHVGAELGVSDWLEIDQARIDAFARIIGTPEAQRGHLDAERAAKEFPGDRAIVPGYLLLSLFPRLTKECLDIGQLRRTLNYGLNQLRFAAPVAVGARVRLRQTISAVEKAKGDGIRLTLDGVLEVEHVEHPAVVGQSLRIVYP